MAGKLSTKMIHHTYPYLGTRICTAVMLAWLLFGDFSWWRFITGGILYFLVAAVETA